MRDISEVLRNSTSPKDWPEDASHENGNYLCVCCVCDFVFTGHKRRVLCKECAHSPDTGKQNV